MKKIEQSSIVDLSENSKLSEKIENWPNWGRWSRAQYSKGGGRLDFENIKNFHILMFLKNVVDEACKHDFVM